MRGDSAFGDVGEYLMDLKDFVKVGFAEWKLVWECREKPFGTYTPERYSSTLFL